MNVGSGGRSSGGESGSFPPAMSSPALGSTLTSSTVTFTGGHTSQDLEHWPEIGTSVGASPSVRIVVTLVILDSHRILMEHREVMI